MSGRDDFYEESADIETAIFVCEKEPELKAIIKQFRDDELGHKETGLKHDAEKAHFYKPMTEAIKAATRTAIVITERI